MKYPSVEDADLVITSKGCTVYYWERSKDLAFMTMMNAPMSPGAVYYEPYAWDYGSDCVDCGGGTIRVAGADPLTDGDCRDYNLCLDCGAKITNEYVEAKIISSG